MENMSADARFKTFERRCDLDGHIQKHLHLLKEDNKLFCPYPKCRHNVEEETLTAHFEYIHAIEASSTNGIEAVRSKRKGDADWEEAKPPKKKSLGKTNNSSKTQNEHGDMSTVDDQSGDLSNVPPLDNQFEDLEHSNGSSLDDRFEDFDHENLFVDWWEKDWKDFLDANPYILPDFSPE